MAARNWSMSDMFAPMAWSAYHLCGMIACSADIGIWIYLGFVTLDVTS